MPHAPFVHLHMHSQYSLLDGTIRFGELFSLAKAYRMPALALTDHGNLFGAVEFYEEAYKAGIKPIIGCEVYIAPGSRFEKLHQGIADASYHLILLARNQKGYRNLLRLVSASYMEGFYYRPRVDKELLSRHHEGLIALSACMHGEIPHLVLLGKIQRARDAVAEYRDIFGKGNFYLEIQDNGIPEQSRINQGLVALGREMSIPLVATNDCHYLRQHDSKAHEVLLCIQTGKTLKDADRMRFQTDQFYFKSADEMLEAFRELPEAIHNTIEIAQHCNLEIEFDNYHFPQFPTEGGVSLEDQLEQIARSGFEQRFKELVSKNRGFYLSRESEYRERLEEELKVIRSMGFSSYFLIVADFINYAKKQNIPVGPGRGSAAGSLVAYSLGITDIDPIEYNLLFERFLNPERRSMPDIDIDFCMVGRDEVIRYVTYKYGEDRVAQIITFGKMQAKAVIRDVGRAMDIPYGEVDRIAKLVPNVLNITLDEALQQEPRLRRLQESDPRVAELLKIARSLEGLARHASTHAAGVVISDRPIYEYLPLYKGQKGELVTQYDMKSIEKIGLIKFDFLGLRTLTVIDHAVRLLRQRGVELDINKIPLDEKRVYELLGMGETAGIFQLESSGMKDLLVRMKPERFEDIIALVALYRPGPLGSNMIDDFIDRKQGKVPISYEVPQLEEILKDTYGVIVYQEQVMKIASTLANYSMGEADILRKAMGKKIPHVMEEEKQHFLEGARKQKINRSKAERIFELMAKFGEYGFNKSHSAAYAMVAYQTAYLKALYPVEFMAALLTSEKDSTDKIVKYIDECRSKGIEVLPPDVNESERDFSVAGGKIRFGLAAIKNVGEGAIEAILAARASCGPFKSLYDFCERVDAGRVNKRTIESLIKCGGFDSTGAHRAQLMACLEKAVEEGLRRQRDQAAGQGNLFERAIGKAKPEAAGIPLPDVEPWSEQERLAYEKETLGFYVTGHPLKGYSNAIKRLANTDTFELASMKDGSEVRLIGIARTVKEITTKKGERMAFVTLEDLKGFVEVLVFSDLYGNVSEILHSDQPLFVKGTLDLKEENPKVKLTEVRLLREAMASDGDTALLRIKADGLSEETMKGIRQILERHRGPSPVALHLVLPQGREAVISIDSNITVDPGEETEKELKALLEDRLLGFGVI